MVWLDLLFVLIIAVILTAVFSAGLRGQRGPELLAFFVVLALLTWAAGLWLPPFGHPVLGVFWVTFLVTAVFFTILLVSLTPPGRPAVGSKTGVKEREIALFGAFFWLLILALALAIAGGYYLDRPGARLDAVPLWPAEADGRI